tara:strand:- start:39 stop:986 length:948 start_codon:yes stop_codon:yes gene_type:complete
MADPLAFLKLYGAAQRQGYATYPNGCTTGSAGTILQSTFGGSTTAIFIGSFAAAGSVWFYLAANNGTEYVIGSSDPEAHGFAAGQIIYVDNSDDSMPTQEFGDMAAGALESGYYTIIAGPENVVVIVKNTDNEDIFAQPHGCNGNINFNASTFTGPQDSSINVTVTRTKGTFGPVTGALGTPGGTAVNGTDYTFLPTRLFWGAGEDDTKTITVTTINAWADGDKTIGFGFNQIDGAFTGNVNADTTVTITNLDVTETSADAYPPISPDGTINNYRNAFTSRKNKGAVPFAYGIKTPFAIRDIISAYSGSTSGQKI